MSMPPPSRRMLLRAAAAATLAALALPAAAHRSIGSQPSPRVAMTVIDRATGQYLAVYNSNGQIYLEGRPGREYAIRLTNTTPRRVLAVTSVDGINVISGDTASPDQSGYVLEPHGSVEIIGWRKSLSRTAAFFFSEHSQSYAARTGRPFDVGVIGVAVFEERPARPQPPRVSQDAGGWSPRRRAEAPAAEPSAADGSRSLESQALAKRPPTPLATGHGRSETSHVRTVNFERATSAPVEILAFRYDRYENLVAQGIIPAQPHYANRDPRPFPGGMRFAPDPN